MAPPSPLTPVPAWDSEVVVVHAADRTALRRRVRALAEEGIDDATLPELAFQLNSDLPDGRSRLAVVASSVADLRDKLATASELLADPECDPINDSQGLYHFDRPLGPTGKLAVLFAGEGSQYLDMLADLPAHFPEVRDHLASCDRLSLTHGGRGEPITRTVFARPGLAAAERAAAETELWRLHNAAGSVLMMNWALYHLVRGLGIRADVFAGHSTGEISALAAAGCYPADEFLFGQLMALGAVLERLEDEGEVGEAVLLAVAAGRAKVDALLAAERLAADVAMDNCPHQTVLAGPAEVMTAVEARLKAKGILSERLPFRRPYHTPRFEPLLGPIATMFAALPFGSPHVPVYSCVTARPFPTDPRAIRDLAVKHWAARVEWTKLIETLYADGVRVFVESGPRGNLTSFVQDTLRRKPIVAIAANVPHRSGIAQLNHLAAQLAAHHVPLDLGFLTRDRITPLCRPAPRVAKQNGDEVLMGYWDLMDDFVQAQRQVMEQYLRGGDGLAVIEEAPPLPLLGDVVRHVPGRELVLRRVTDLDEDLYALDHTIGGRHASAFDPDWHGIPVMPMALSLEMMAEAASLLAPGKTLVGVDRLRLHRWIPFDDEPVVLEVQARVASDDTGLSRVVVAIHDHGNETRPGNSETPSVEATVLFADAYPEPPEVDDFPLTNERPCRYTPEQMYEGERRLFHGPTFQSVVSTDRFGDEGIEGHLLTRPFVGLFRSDPEPDLLTDPLLVDTSTHVLGCWHLGQDDQTGRVVLPYELGQVRFYGPRPEAGTLVKCRVSILRESARQVSHRIDLITPDERLWCRLEPAEYWRFYWPREFVHYFRFKEDNVLAHRWDAVKANGPEAVCVRLTPPPDLTQSVMRGGVAHVSLSRAEWQQFRTLSGPDHRVTEWVFGRLAAKDAVRLLWHERTGDKLFPADLEIEPDEHGRPVVHHPGLTGLPNVSISHTDGLVVALAAFRPHVGVDVERIQPRGPGFETVAFSEAEMSLVRQWPGGRDEAITRLWCAKEAVGKALGRGLVEGPRSFVAQSLAADGTVSLALGPQLAERFPALRLDLLKAHAVRDGDLIVATSFAERS